MTVEEYNKCVNKYSDGAFRFILKSIKDSDKAQDVVQDAFERMWNKHTEVEYSKAKSYIFSTAYHAMIDMIRREKKMRIIEETDLSGFSHRDQYSDLQEILHKAIDRLPHDQKSVILLRDYEGYAYSEIAEITNLSEAQVKVYIYRARLFLKNHIGKIEVVI